MGVVFSSHSVILPTCIIVSIHMEGAEQGKMGVEYEVPQTEYLARPGVKKKILNLQVCLRNRLEY